MYTFHLHQYSALAELLHESWMGWGLFTIPGLVSQGLSRRDSGWEPSFWTWESQKQNYYYIVTLAYNSNKVCFIKNWHLLACRNFYQLSLCNWKKFKPGNRVKKPLQKGAKSSTQCIRAYTFNLLSLFRLWWPINASEEGWPAGRN